MGCAFMSDEANSAVPALGRGPWAAGRLGLLALALSVLFFAPRLWLMRTEVPGSFQWDRAHTFLQQCEQPFRRDIEPAMLWRLLPPLVAHALHLPGKTPLVLPWLGLLAATWYAATLLQRQKADIRFVLGGTLLFTTTSAALVPIGWLGMNDAWVWLGLLAVSFGRSSWALPLACLLCPWIDERFVIGFPLAWLVARMDRGEPLMGSAALGSLWLLPYVVGRLGLGAVDTQANASTTAFFRTQLPEIFQRLPFAPLGWWMGLRAAWGAAAYGAWTGRHRWTAAITALLTLGLMAVLASDLSRSAAVLVPLVFAGCLTLARRHPTHAPRLVLAAGLVNLLIPAAHVTYVHIDPISPLPLELFRLLRQ